ncbi:hypothetical protein UA45_20925, partial [Morganella morganii]
FYAKDWIDDYGDSYPADAIDVDESVFIEYTSAAPVGKVRVAGKKGVPQWADEPPLTHEQHVAIAESQKQVLIAEASEKTELWRTQLMLGIITDEDKASLKEWMLYVQKVQAVDPSPGAAVVWPIPPVSPAR